MAPGNSGYLSTLGLSPTELGQFLKYISGLPEKPVTTIRFYNHGDFYSLHGDDAELASKFSGWSVKYMKDKPTESYQTLNKLYFERFIRDLLLIKQYRVEVHIKSNNKWTLEYRGSPGNLSQFEDILFDNSDMTFSNTVMGVKQITKNSLAIACINTTELTMEICELNDNECLTELEALLAQISPRECLISDTEQMKSLKKLLERNGVLVAEIKRSNFQSNDIVQDLNRLLFFQDGSQRNANNLPELLQKNALDSLQAVIKFLNLTNDERNFNQFKLKTIDLHRYVRLDNAALKSLNILPNPETTTVSSNDPNDFFFTNSPKSRLSYSIFGILDCCVTNQGKRLLEQWIKQPLKDYNLINERLEIVEYLVRDAETRKVLQTDCLTRSSDLLPLSKKLSSKKCSLQDCFRIYQVISNVPKLIDVLNATCHNYIKSVLVDPINEILIDLKKYESLIEEVVDFNSIERGEFLIKHTVDENLAEVYERKLAIESRMLKLLKETTRDLNCDEKTVKLECKDQYGYYFRVTLNEERSIRSNKKYQIIDAIKGGVRFTNEKLKSLNELYIVSKEDYETEQKSILTEVFKVAAGYAETLRNLNLHMATVDVLLSFACVAVSAQIPYVRPTFIKDGPRKMNLKMIRHPCVEQQENISYIPNSVEFDENAKNFHIITGPNMCGKSTYIRSIGVCVLLAHIGSFVPCQSAEMSIVDAIYARVGANDSPIKGLSTFMLEMMETSTILASATANSLVIIDELGRGTSTYDGCGIAWAISEELSLEIKCFSLFATHFHELMRLAETYPSFNNLHVTALIADDKITPLYQVREGECDKSFGIHCARLADFPEDVINWAVEHQKCLEHSKGMRYIKDFESSLKRKVVKEGDELIKETLEKVKSFKENLSHEEYVIEMKKLKLSLQKCDNLFIKGLLNPNTD